MVRSDLVVLPEPSIDCDLSLFGGVEPFRVEHFFDRLLERISLRKDNVIKTYLQLI